MGILFEESDGLDSDDEETNDSGFEYNEDNDERAEERT
jgi:hypothetical protein